MKKAFLGAIIFLMTGGSHAQNQYIDSLKKRLSFASKPLARFDLLDKILENDISSGSNIDSAACIQMLQLSRQLKSDSLLAISYNMVGAFIAKNGDYPDALEYLFKAIPLAEKSADKRRLSSLYFDISLIYINLQNPYQSAVYNEKGGENLPDPSSPNYYYMAAQFDRNKVRYLLSQDKPDSALPYAQHLEQVGWRLKSPVILIPALFLNGAVYSQLGQEDMAAVYFKKANRLTDSVSSAGLKMTNGKYFIPFLLKNNQLQDASEHAQKLLALGLQTHNNDLTLTAAIFLREVFDRKHQVDSAYYYSKMESSLKDSVFSQQNINRMQVLSFKEELRVLEEEGKRFEAAAHRRQNIQMALIAFGIVVFVLLFLLLSHSIVANERWISFFGVLGLLTLFEFINLLIEPSLSSLTNDSPVLMLAGLVAIASLLIPLHHRTEKWIRESMTAKNKAIRLAAAKKVIEKLEGRQNS